MSGKSLSISSVSPSFKVFTKSFSHISSDEYLLISPPNSQSFRARKKEEGMKNDEKINRFKTENKYVCV